MILWPLGRYQPLTVAGQCRLSVRWCSRARLAWLISRLHEGTVYQAWCGPVMFKLMVKA